MEFQITKILSPFRFLCVFYPPRNFHSQFVFGLAIILILLLDLATVTYYAPFVFDVSTRVRFLLDISQVYAPVLSYAVIIIEAALSRHRLAMIWKNIESVVRIFERDLQMNTSSQLRGVLRKFILFGILIQLACTGIELGIILGIRKNASWLKNRWSAFPGFLGCRTAILLYILYVQIIGFLLESLGQCQRQITSQGVDRIPNRLLRFDRRRVERQLHLRRIFSKVALITRLLNESFKWSLLLNFLTNVFCICIAWFWNYVALRFGNRYLFGEVILYCAIQVNLHPLCRIDSLLLPPNYHYPGRSWSV